MTSATPPPGVLLPSSETATQSMATSLLGGRGKVVQTAEKVNQLVNFAHHLLTAGIIVLLMAAPISTALGLGFWVIREVVLIGVTLLLTGIAALISSVSWGSLNDQQNTGHKPRFGFLGFGSGNTAQALLASLDEHEFKDFSSLSAESVVPKSLVNQGNNCWVNAFMQMVLNSDLLRRYLTSHERWEELDTELQQKESELKEEINQIIAKKRVLAAFNLFIKNYQSEEDQPDSQMIREAIRFLQEDPMDSDSQEDASEVFGILRNAELLPNFPMNRVIEGKEVDVATKKPVPSGKATSTTKEESLFIVDLTMDGKTQLITLLNIFCSKEKKELKKDEPFKKEDGEHSGKTFKKDLETYQFLTPPEELFISLNRYTFDGRTSPSLEGTATKVDKATQTEKVAYEPQGTRKNKTEINVHFVISLEEGTHVQEGEGKYLLTSFISHIGMAESGHYVSYVRKGAKWHLCDDARSPEEITEEAAKAAAASGYLFHYVIE